MLLDTEFRKAQKDSRELVVVVHGLSRTMLDHVPRCVAENMPTADVLIPKYSSGWLSNVDAVQLADELSGTIQSHYDRRERETGKPYERVILIGHSRGALFIRKAYVFASGQNHELWQGPLRPTPKAWARAVTRVVLLAGMHRGWSLSPKPPKMSWRRCLWLRSCDLMATLCRTARLMRAIKRGAPFVANLRVQWINLVRADHPMPVTVQILGNMDDLVSSSDNIDLQSGYNFIYLNAPPGTTHGGVADLSDPDRERVFLNALLTPDELLKSEYAVPETQKPEPSVEQVVFIMHGIRDFGGWTQRLASTITRQSQDQGRRVVTVTSSYGYFPMIKFLIFSERQQNVRWFMDQFTEALAKYPKARPIDFAGHSNGTYLLASALKRYRACAFGRAVFAGTVVPRGFEWNEMVDQGRVQAIRNYVATGDWVVGIFPRLFERMGDIGGAGLLGFEREPAANLEFHYVKGGHGAGIATKNFESITAFLLDGGSRPPPPAITRSEQNRLVILLSKLYWLVWLILIGVIISAAWWVAFAWSPAFVPSPWLRVAIFILLLLAVLNSI
jgi:predicted esterase